MTPDIIIEKGYNGNRRLKGAGEEIEFS